MNRQRVLFFLLSGAILCLVGIVLIVWARLQRSIDLLVGGIGIYSLAMPLLVHARVAKLEDKVRDLQAKWHGHCSAGRTAPHSDEPEEPEAEPAASS